MTVLLWVAGVVLAVAILLVVFGEWGQAAVGRFAALLLSSCALSAMLVTPLRVVARRCGIVDVPDARKQHAVPTPLLGGLAIYAAFMVTVLTHTTLTWPLRGILIGGTVVLLVGVLDDLRPVRAPIKLVATIVAALVVIASGTTLTVFPGGSVWSQALNACLAMLWVVGITAAMNFLDGMDGLAPGLASIAASFLVVLALHSQQVQLASIAIVLLGSALGFLPYNFRPGKHATMFLGDAGSTFLGFTLASMALLGRWAEGGWVGAAVLLLVFGVWIYDMVYLTVARVAAGNVKSFREWLDYVGRDHLHHRLEELLGRRDHAVLFVFVLSGTFGLGATVLLMASPVAALLLVLQAAMTLVLVTVLERHGRRTPPVAETQDALAPAPRDIAAARCEPSWAAAREQRGVLRPVVQVVVPRKRRRRHSW